MCCQQRWRCALSAQSPALLAASGLQWQWLPQRLPLHEQPLCNQAGTTVCMNQQLLDYSVHARRTCHLTHLKCHVLLRQLSAQCIALGVGCRGRHPATVQQNTHDKTSQAALSHSASDCICSIAANMHDQQNSDIIAAMSGLLVVTGLASGFGRLPYLGCCAGR